MQCFERVCFTYIPCPLLVTVSDAFLSLLSAGCVCVYQGSGRDVAGRLFGLDFFWGIFFRCAMVVCTLFMWFLGGKCYLRKKSWCMRSQHFGYQATDKERLGNGLWYFQNSILLYGQMLWAFYVFHFWTTAVKKAGVCICLDVVLQFSVATDTFLHLFGMKLNLVTTLFGLEFA